MIDADVAGIELELGDDRARTLWIPGRQNLCAEVFPAAKLGEVIDQVDRIGIHPVVHDLRWLACGQSTLRILLVEDCDDSLPLSALKRFL